MNSLSADFGFELDDFQLAAIAAIDQGRSVVVAAPTGSGKTVVAEHAVAVTLRAVSGRGKVFYTTPVKALSNQKFHDLKRRHGADQVGLLTGDNSINGEAPVVVMTTEVLRNMIYAGSPTLVGLRWVILDEVHYLQDRYRGPVWEEVIIHLDPGVGLVCLSATVSNADELADWIGTVRGPTDLVLETRRPVRLDHHYLVGERGSGHTHLLPVLVEGRPNARGAEYDIDNRRRRGGGRRRWVTPRRVEVLEVLAGRNYLPMIYFVFSRAGCDDAVRACQGAGISLTDEAEQARIDELITGHVSPLTASELRAVGFDRWRSGLLAGIASHHAGLVPPFKETVEACFVEGLVKAVFATETLALGINMPARSVVLERLSKFTGETHESLTPGQYTQFTGRAGRRGIDDLGHAVVLWSPWVPFKQIADLARSRDFDLESAFRPTYNMTANLVSRHSPDEAHRLLRASFGQFQADRQVVALQRQADDAAARAATLLAEVDEQLPDGTSLREFLDDESNAARSRRRRDVEDAVRRLAPGDVIMLDGLGPVAVLSVAQRGPFSRLKVIGLDGEPVARHSTGLSSVPEQIATITLPIPFQPNDPGIQAAVVDALRTVAGGTPSTPGQGTRAGPRRPVKPAVRRRARKALRAQAEAEELAGRVGEGTENLAIQFDRVLRVLDAWEYLDGWVLTQRGERLSRLYHERDLLVTEAMDQGLFDDLGPSRMVGLVSCLTYEHRGAGDSEPPQIVDRLVARRVRDLGALAEELRDLEEAERLPLTPLPDPGFLQLALGWAEGEDLDELLADSGQSGGDFVRNVKQLLDLTRQIATLAPDPATREDGRVACARLRRGVVATSSLASEDHVHRPG